MAQSNERSSPLPRAIAFDCYGTLLRIANQRRPYQRLAMIAGARLDPSPMLRPFSLADVVARNVTPIEINDAELSALQNDLEDELASVVLVDDAGGILRRLRQSGYRLGVVSNLAMPYAEPIHRLVGPMVDASVFSFEFGSAKPSPEIFASLCNALNADPGDVLMIGDSRSNDYDGAIDGGLRARHLRTRLELAYSASRFALTSAWRQL